MSPATDDTSPPRRGRQHELVQRLVGKKVIVSTTDQHFVVGRLVSVTDAEGLRLTVKGRPVLLRESGLVRIQEVDEAHAEFIK